MKAMSSKILLTFLLIFALHGSSSGDEQEVKVEQESTVEGLQQDQPEVESPITPIPEGQKIEKVDPPSKEEVSMEETNDYDYDKKKKGGAKTADENPDAEEEQEPLTPDGGNVVDENDADYENTEPEEVPAATPVPKKKRKKGHKKSKLSKTSAKDMVKSSIKSTDPVKMKELKPLEDLKSIESM